MTTETVARTLTVQDGSAGTLEEPEMFRPVNAQRIRLVQKEVDNLRRAIIGVWVLFAVLLGITGVLLNRGELVMSDLGGFLQGTVGIAAMVISILYLVVSIKGTEKQIIFASDQNGRQFAEAVERGRRDVVEREKMRLDGMLEARTVLLAQLGATPAGSPVLGEHVAHLLRRARSYLCSATSADEIRRVADRDLAYALKEDPYVSHLSLLFEVASQNEGEHRAELIDHVWHGLTIEERALGALLTVSGIPLPTPSVHSLRSWRVAAQAALPWDWHRLSLDELLK